MDDDTVPCVVSPRFMVGRMEGGIPLLYSKAGVTPPVGTKRRSRALVVGLEKLCESSLTVECFIGGRQLETVRQRSAIESKSFFSQTKILVYVIKPDPPYPA